MTAHVPTAHEVETFTGRYVDTQRPQPSTICLEDVAHALANTCRYGGHCRTFYSVAEHAVFCSYRVERKGGSTVLQLAALHHDDAEAYLGDIPRPLKPLLGKGYERLSDRMDAAIAEGVLFQHLPDGAATFHHPLVKSADNWALLVEARFLLPSKGINWAGSALDAWAMHDAPSRVVVPDYWIGGLEPAAAEKLFLDRHHELTDKEAA